MATSLTFDLDEVLPLMRSRITGFKRVEGMQAIGLVKDGRVIAGTVYEGFNGQSVWVHLAAEPGAKWLTRFYLRACFAYPFIQLGVKQLRGYVEASNVQACRFDEHIGYRLDTVLKGAASDGGDVRIYLMRREDCRYI